MYVGYNHLVKKPANRAQFAPDIEYWLDPNNTYHVVFIQVSIEIIVNSSDYLNDLPCIRAKPPGSLLPETIL